MFSDHTAHAHSTPTPSRYTDAPTPGVFDFCPHPFSEPMLEFTNHEERA
jgi:hypothetical protein